MTIFSPLPDQPVPLLSFAEGRLRLTPRDFVIEETAVTASRSPDEHPVAVIKLDPGLAFGSGLHPTTQLCLDGLAWLAREGALTNARVLDYGCGSGVLALAARALGAPLVHAVDHDPQALVATADNAAYNNLSQGLGVFAPSELPNEARYEVVVANILANPLIELADDLSNMLLPGGTLILAGLLASQADSVAAAYGNVLFQLPASHSAPQDPNDEEHWVRLQGQKSGSFESA